MTVPALASWLVLVQGVLKVDELAIRNILDKLPLDWNRSWPFLRLAPQVLVVGLVIDRAQHPSEPLEVLRFVHAEEQVNLALRVRVLLVEGSHLFEGLVQNLVSTLGRAPEAVLD